MSDQTNVFDNNNNNNNSGQETPDQKVNPQGTNTFSDQLKAIVAEDGRQKYNTVEDALTALAHSQSYIPTLKSEKETLEAEVTKLREELAKRESVQDIVDKLTQHQQEGDQGGHHSEKPLGEEDVLKLLNNTLEQRELQSRAVSNTQKVVTALTEIFGDKVKDAVAQKAKELNTTPEEIGKLAEKTPDLVLNLFQAKSHTSNLTHGSINLGTPQEPTQELTRPDKSLLAGASSKDQLEYMRRIREHVHKKYDVKTD